MAVIDGFDVSVFVRRSVDSAATVGATAAATVVGEVVCSSTVDRRYPRDWLVSATNDVPMIEVAMNEGHMGPILLLTLATNNAAKENSYPIYCAIQLIVSELQSMICKRSDEK